MQIGSRIRHSRLGLGTVTSSESHGRVDVRFDCYRGCNGSGQPLWVLVSDIEVAA